MDEFHLLTNRDFPESNKTSGHGDGKKDDLNMTTMTIVFASKPNAFSSLRDLWTKHSLMIELALSIAANLLFGVLSFILLKKFKALKFMQTSLPEVSLYSQYTHSHGLSNIFDLILVLAVILPYVSHGQKVTGLKSRTIAWRTSNGKTWISMLDFLQ